MKRRKARKWLSARAPLINPMSARRSQRKYRTSDTAESEWRPPLGVPCARCNVIIPPYEQDVIATKAGSMHSRCFNSQPLVAEFRAIVEGSVESAVEQCFDGPDKEQLTTLLGEFRDHVGTNGQAKRMVVMIVRKLDSIVDLAAETHNESIALVLREAVQSLRAAGAEFLPCAPEISRELPKLHLAVGRVPFIRLHSPAHPYR